MILRKVVPFLEVFSHLSSCWAELSQDPVDRFQPRCPRSAVVITLLILPALAFLCGCAEVVAPRETPAPESPSIQYGTPAQIAEWESTLLARSDSSCRRVVWQMKRETLSDAVAVYEQNYLPGDCLALEPTGATVAGVPYGAIYIGFGGTFDSNLPPDQWTCGENWPGHCLTYLADTPIPPPFPSTNAQSKN